MIQLRKVERKGWVIFMTVVSKRSWMKIIIQLFPKCCSSVLFSFGYTWIKIPFQDWWWWNKLPFIYVDVVTIVFLMKKIYVFHIITPGPKKELDFFFLYLLTQYSWLTSIQCFFFKMKRIKRAPRIQYNIIVDGMINYEEYIAEIFEIKGS